MRYGVEGYGLVLYGDPREGGDAPAGGEIDLLAMLPEHWRVAEEVQALQYAAGRQASKLREAVLDLLDQLDLEKAAWGLELWERAFGLEGTSAKSYAFRRERVKAKMRGTGPTTVQRVVNVASAFAGGEAVVVEYPDEFRFVVRFVGVKGVPANLKDLTASIQEIIPAHLVFTYEYTYNCWDFLAGNTWNDLSGKTWDQAKVI